jgi:hypothetical protein
LQQAQKQRLADKGHAQQQGLVDIRQLQQQGLVEMHHRHHPAEVYIAQCDSFHRQLELSVEAAFAMAAASPSQLHLPAPVPAFLEAPFMPFRPLPSQSSQAERMAERRPRTDVDAELLPKRQQIGSKTVDHSWCQDMMSDQQLDEQVDDVLSLIEFMDGVPDIPEPDPPCPSDMLSPRTVGLFVNATNPHVRTSALYVV